eukprot:m.6871 g.6871  ORF g.6871 m.6871 type:complete len:117 (-) comp8617_c0_seq5:644-994(-)
MFQADDSNFLSIVRRRLLDACLFVRRRRKISRFMASLNRDASCMLGPDFDALAVHFLSSEFEVAVPRMQSAERTRPPSSQAISGKPFYAADSLWLTALASQLLRLLLVTPSSASLI